MNENCSSVEAGGGTAAPWRRRLPWAMGALLVLALALLAFLGYGQPELLLDYINLRYCG